jgi:hypothetical protein
MHLLVCIFLSEVSSVFHFYDVQVSFLFEFLHACYFVSEIGNLDRQCSVGVVSHHGCQFIFGFLICVVVSLWTILLTFSIGINIL